MNKNIEKIINDYIKVNVSSISRFNGCLVCGSYVSGTYTEDSDIDILFLDSKHIFEMILERYENVLFDRLIVCPEILLNILKEESVFSNILSLSFGLAQKVYIQSDDIKEIIGLAKNNICTRNLSYFKDVSKPKKIVDNIPFLCTVVKGKYHLVKNDIILL